VSSTAGGVASAKQQSTQEAISSSCAAAAAQACLRFRMRPWSSTLTSTWLVRLRGEEKGRSGMHREDGRKQS
jgi:hypothetical protein